MDESGILKKIRSYKEAASQEMNIIRKEGFENTESLHRHMLTYVKNKYMIDENDCSSDRLYDLIQASMDKSMNAPKGSAAEAELASGCGGVSSAVTKKILLFMSIQKELSIKFPPETVPEVKTVMELTQLIQKMQENINDRQ